MKRICKQISFAFIIIMVSGIGYAANIIVGEKLPLLVITSDGECVIEGKEVAFRSWVSNSAAGRVQIIEHTAARAGIDRVNQQFFKAFSKAGFSPEDVVITKLVNANDAAWGTSGFVAPEVKKSKLKEPETVFVVDAEGVGQKRWGLKKKSAAIVILDRSGAVLFFKESSLTDVEIKNSIELIKQYIQH